MGAQKTSLTLQLGVLMGLEQPLVSIRAVARLAAIRLGLSGS